MASFSDAALPQGALAGVHALPADALRYCLLLVDEALEAVGPDTATVRPRLTRGCERPSHAPG